MNNPINQIAVREIIHQQYNVIREQTETISKLVGSNLSQQDIIECVNAALKTAFSAVALLAKLADVLGMDNDTKIHVANQQVILENFKSRINSAR